MTTQQQLYSTLREKMNELLPERLELKFGCEVIPYRREYEKGVQPLTILDVRNVNEMRGTTCEVYKKNENGVGNVSYESHLDLRILGTPVTLQEILRVLPFQEYTTETYWSDDNSLRIYFFANFSGGRDSKVTFDLTLPVSEQSVETLEWIIKTISE